MSMDWLQQNAGNGDSNPGVYFGTVGTKLVGQIVALPRQVSTQYGDRLVVEMCADEGTTAHKGPEGADGPIGAGELVTLWIKPGAMASAVADAVRAVNAAGLAEGDTLAVAYSGQQDTGKPSKLKLYQARYTPAKTAVDIDNLV